MLAKIPPTCKDSAAKFKNGAIAFLTVVISYFA